MIKRSYFHPGDPIVPRLCENWVYADEIEKYLQQLNCDQCTPFTFHAYATYEVTSQLSDLKNNFIIDKLNTNLQSTDNFNGPKYILEFYAISPEDAIPP